MTGGEETKTTVGTVEEVLPNSLFRVRIQKDLTQPSAAEEEPSGGPEALQVQGEGDDATQEEPLVLAYLAGKMRLHRIRVLMGDQVEMVLDPYGGRARIVRRLT